MKKTVAAIATLAALKAQGYHMRLGFIAPMRQKLRSWTSAR